MPNLMDRTRGYAAFAVRRALGRSPDARVEELERRVKELERLLALSLRTFNGHTINDFNAGVGLDHKRRTHWRSSDGKVVLSQIEGVPYGVDLSVDEAALTLPDPGCANALAGIVDCDATTADVTGCGDRLEFHAGTYIAAQTEAPDSAGNIAVRLDWCAPEGKAAPEFGACSFPGQFDGWAELSVGDACTGGCVTVIVPYWLPA